jgi:hypothetical protein
MQPIIDSVELILARFDNDYKSLRTRLDESESQFKAAVLDFWPSSKVFLESFWTDHIKLFTFLLHLQQTKRVID